MAAHILIINDDHLMRKVIAICLNDAGWSVSSNDYAHIDLLSLKQLSPDMIILDFKKQDGGTGWKFLQMLKMNDETARIPVMIMTTAFFLSAEIRGYLLARHIQVVYQPFELKIFIDLVRQTLTQSKVNMDSSYERTLPILVVDDMEELRKGLETILMLEGYHVVTAENGLLALNAISQGAYRLILLDMNMPIMDGFEFLRIYDQQPGPHVPVIVVSAEPDIKLKVFPSFVVDVLPKPYEVGSLLRLAEIYTQPI